MEKEKSSESVASFFLAFSSPLLLLSLLFLDFAAEWSVDGDISAILAVNLLEDLDVKVKSEPLQAGENSMLRRQESQTALVTTCSVGLA